MVSVSREAAARSDRRSVDNPVKGRRTIAVRRLQIGGPERKSHLFVSMVEDRTGQTDVAVPTEAAA
ncbi:hypothetical protein [Bradyrhizobium sp. RDI18]|uniref:hypothetical protein n=1 Tax=Bradyrhizobium sp. RDI18 TaxID=3367400 RepID=UPI003711F1A9